MDGQNLLYWQERIDLAAAFRWAARLNMHEAVANHFSLSVNDDGTQFLMNPNQKHFSRIKASDMLLLDANDPDTMNKPGAPDPTAWGCTVLFIVNVHMQNALCTCIQSTPPCSLPLRIVVCHQSIKIRLFFTNDMSSTKALEDWPLKMRACDAQGCFRTQKLRL